jgi:hypothetical protein
VLFDIVQAADQLDIRSLLELACARVALVVIALTVEEAKEALDPTKKHTGSW